MLQALLAGSDCEICVILDHNTEGMSKSAGWSVACRLLPYYSSVAPALRCAPYIHAYERMRTSSRLWRLSACCHLGVEAPGTRSRLGK